MEAFLTRPKRKSSLEPTATTTTAEATDEDADEEPTEVKLALLSSLHPGLDQEVLLDILLAHDGSVSQASASLRMPPPTKMKNGGGAVGYQKSLKQYTTPKDHATPTATATSASAKKKLKSKKGSTLRLYDPDDVAEHTPCTIIHNFLPVEEANELLRELLEESKTYQKITFQLFDNVVSSPHTSSFYVESYDEIRSQKTEYHYNGARLTVCVVKHDRTRSRY